MAPRIAKTARMVCGLLALALMSGISGAPASQSAPPSTVAIGFRQLVHLRKLHLVRPDLILYPISFPVYC